MLPCQIGNIMEKKTLYKLIENFNSPDVSDLKSNFNYKLDIASLENIVEEYPYFQTARLLNTIHLQIIEDDRYSEALPRTAILCADRKKLFYLTQKEDYKKLLKLYENSNEEEKVENKDRTEQLLDSYFKTFKDQDQKGTTNEHSGLSIVSTDYFTYLETLDDDKNSEQSTNNPMQHQDIIDAFIEKKESDSIHITPIKSNTANKKEPYIPDSENDDGDNQFLTETLAKIYIKQKKYEQALTIIKRLSLNFPKKSAYFADQIRFLEFLIINEKNS